MKICIIRISFFLTVRGGGANQNLDLGKIPCRHPSVIHNWFISGWVERGGGGVRVCLSLHAWDGGGGSVGAAYFHSKGLKIEPFKAVLYL